MGQHQISLELDVSYNAAPAAPADIRDEIAQVWALPLGQRVEVCFRGSERAAATGTLELISTPDFPWNPRQSLELRIAGLGFSSRDIDRWTNI